MLTVMLLSVLCDAKVKVKCSLLRSYLLWDISTRLKSFLSASNYMVVK